MIIEQEHLQALFDENEIIIAEAEANNQRNTAIAYHAQQLVIQRFNRSPDISETMDIFTDAPNKPVKIQGFEFEGCSAAGCQIMAPCPKHQHMAWQEAVNKQWGAQRGTKRLG